MAENTNIEWTDHTWNPWRGCEHATLPNGSPHAGCLNCYAEAMAKRNPGTLGVWGAAGRRVVAAEAYWKLPAKWNAAAEREGVRKRVFCASLADVFEDWEGVLHAPNGAVVGCDDGEPATMADVRHRVFEVIDETPWLDWILLTKRPENVLRMWPVPASSVAVGHGITLTTSGPRYRPNVWLVASVSDQPSFDATVSAMQDLHNLCPVRGLSAEPLIGPIDWRAKVPPYCASHLRGDRINWLILGGESGSDARPCEVEWIRSGVKACRDAEIPAFVKQLGKRPATRLPDHERWPGHSGPLSSVQFEGDGYGRYFVHGLRDKKGGDPAEWPVDLCVRQWPEVRA